VARIVFTQQLRRFTETPEVTAPVATLRAALDAAFALNPRLRGYVLDEQGHMRGNVVAFIDGRRCMNRVKLVVNRTRDGGKTFETLRSGLPHESCYDLIYRHGLVIDETGRRLLMGSTTGGLWASEDAGDCWATVSAHLPPIYAVRFG
jgi:hypothetical protein